MSEIILTLVFVILVPVAFLSLIATYALCKMAFLFVVEELLKVYRYAGGKFKDNEK